MSNEITLNKDKLIDLVKTSDFIKDKQFALELLNMNPEDFIRTVFCVAQGLQDSVQTKETIIQETLETCNHLQGKLNDSNELISELTKGITNYENNW